MRLSVQMVTVSGNIFADSKYSCECEEMKSISTNIYNNPEISQAIQAGVGGMARCTADTKLLNVCIGTENKWGTIVLTRLIMEVPVEAPVEVPVEVIIDDAVTLIIDEIVQ